MKAMQTVFLLLLCTSAAFASYMPKDWVSILEPGWRERRNDLLWWRPCISPAASNEVFYAYYLRDMDDGLRETGERLLKELAKPDGGEYAAVSNALDRLSRSGTFGVTNVLGKALTLDRNAYRFQTLRACINAWPADMSGLAASVAVSIPTETIMAWEQELTDILEKRTTVREAERIKVFLGFVALAQPGPACAAAYDRLKLKADPDWQDSLIRKSLAARILASGRDANGYFGRVSKEIGPPPKPDTDEVLRSIGRTFNSWPLNQQQSLTGPCPDRWSDEIHWAAYATAPVRFGVSRHELSRAMADRFAALPDASMDKRGNDTLWLGYVRALKYSADPSVTNVLIAAIDKDMMPNQGSETLGLALGVLLPGWAHNNEARKQFYARTRASETRYFEWHRDEERRTQERKDNRLFLLWWQPDDTSVRSIKARFSSPGEVASRVRTLTGAVAQDMGQFMLKPDADESAVSDYAQKLSQTGTYDATNTLLGFLSDPTNRFRFVMFAANIGAWQPDMSGLAATMTNSFPPETRAEWYSKLTRTDWAASRLWDSPRMNVRKTVFLRAAARIESDADCAAAIDRALPALDSEWHDSNGRRRLAQRFAEAAGEAGEHFKRATAGPGPARPPTPQQLDGLAQKSVTDWPEAEKEFIGGKPPGCDEEGFRVALMLAAKEYDLSERDLLRKLAERFTDITRRNKQQDSASVLLARYTAALKHAERSAAQPDDAAFFRDALNKAQAREGK